MKASSLRQIISLLIEEEKVKRPSMEMPPSPREKTKKYHNLRRPKNEEDKLRDEVQKKLDQIDFDTKNVQRSLKKASQEALTDIGLPSSMAAGTSYGDSIVAVEALVRYLIDLYLKNEKYYSALGNIQWGAPKNAPTYDPDDLNPDEDDISHVNVF